MDTFAGSLRFVDRLMTAKYGRNDRFVISHMPHMIDSTIMNTVQV